jgi:hypothetical protein
MLAPKVTAGLRCSPLAAIVAVTLYAFTESFLSNSFLQSFAVGSANPELPARYRDVEAKNHEVRRLYGTIEDLRRKLEAGPRAS